MGVIRDQGKYKYCDFWSTSYHLSFFGSCFSFLRMLRITVQEVHVTMLPNTVTYGRSVLMRGRFMCIIRTWWMVGNWSTWEIYSLYCEQYVPVVWAFILLAFCCWGIICINYLLFRKMQCQGFSCLVFADHPKHNTPVIHMIQLTFKWVLLEIKENMNTAILTVPTETWALLAAFFLCLRERSYIREKLWLKIKWKLFLKNVFWRGEIYIYIWRHLMDGEEWKNKLQGKFIFYKCDICPCW